ncbi:hypothetical protein [Streptomyces sp. HC307]|uniref:hypothetical protein n=1 Tax=Streptomyces flavusporus TaxID=3385496 RepID=UPI0039175D27
MRHVFPCGTLTLDFVGTLQERRAPVPIERIGSPGLLDSWFVAFLVTLFIKEVPLRASSGLVQAARDAEAVDAGAQVSASGVPVRGRVRGAGSTPVSQGAVTLTSVARPRSWWRRSRSPTTSC